MDIKKTILISLLGLLALPTLTRGATLPEFVCGNNITDARDGKIYPTVKIGAQCWTAKNLDHNNGCGSKAWINNTDAGWCGYYTGGPFANEGLLYQWSAAMNGSTIAGTQGLCPAGWHIPTDAEWCALEQSIDSSITCNSTLWRGVDGGTKLKSGGTSGFNGLLTGDRYAIDGSFEARSTVGSFWSSVEAGANAWFRALSQISGSPYNAKVDRNVTGKASAFSIRCIKNDEEPPLIDKPFTAIEYTLAPTTRTVYNPMSRTTTTQTINPDYTCTPYLPRGRGVSAAPGYVDQINYKKSFPTKTEAINSTVASLTSCLNANNYLYTITGRYRPLQVRPPTAAELNFTAKSACAAAPASGSYLWIDNTNTCAISGGIYNGVSKQVDYIKTLPETIHLRRLFCYNSSLLGCSVADAIVPTYKYNGDLDPKISSINHGFEIVWEDMKQYVGTDVYYEILKKNSSGVYNIVVNKEKNKTAFKDDRLKEPALTQHYMIKAYGSNNSLMASAYIDSSSLGAVKNEVPVTIHGSGFTESMNSSLQDPNAVFMTNKQDPPFTIPCSGFKYSSSNTLADGKCNITNAPTGPYDIILAIGSDRYVLPGGFTVTYPTPTAITIENVSSNLNDGFLRIGSIKGDNLYIGAIVGVKAGSRTSADHYTLSNYNYDTNSFYCNDPVTCPDGLMKFNISDIMSYTDGDLSQIEIYLANDDGSMIGTYKDSVNDPITLQDLGASCVSSTWIWKNDLDPSKLCPPLNYATRIDNCGKEEIWSGTLTCPANYVCDFRTNKCVCTPNSNVCGPDGCGGTRLCTDSSKPICKHDGSACVQCLSSGDCSGLGNYCKDNNKCFY